MKKSTALKGMAHLVPVDNVDTDMIFHNRHLHITDRAKMGQFIFGNLNGYEDFPTRVQPGDILIVGKNFGCGSSRQQAVDGLIALGIGVIVGESFGAIYKRNAINAGLPAIECEGILTTGISNGEVITVDLLTGEIGRINGSVVAWAKPLSKVALEIYQAGSLLELAGI